MKPVSIRFKGFGPYVQEQYIDFTQFEKNGLFLICGETGAGKTTILDAMCVALFGRSSGSKPGDLDKMRCKLCAKEDETLVEFLFDSDGQRYKFLRRGIFKTKNFNEDHKCYVLRDGTEVLISEKKSQVNQKAEELIGLSCDQFRQVVILPQGEFERLLTSKSEEKEAILTTLFHAERWSRIAERVAEQVSARAKALNQEKIRMEAKLSEYGCRDLPALLEKLEGDREALAQGEAQLLEVAARLQESKEAYEQALLENRDFEELERRRKNLELLEKQQETFAAQERQLALAQVAQGLEPAYRAFRESRERLTRGQEGVRRAELRCRTALEAAKAAQAARLAHDRNREAYQEDNARKTVLENARELYGSLAQKAAAAERLEREWKLSDRASRQAEADAEQAGRQWAMETERYDALMDQYRQLQERYRRGIRGVLAADLQPGSPCPVCGSCDHPSPAPRGEHISDAEVDRCHRLLEQQMERVKQSREARLKAEQLRDQARKRLDQAAQTYAAANAELEGALTRKIPGIETAGELERAITAVKNRIWAFDTAEQKTAGDLMTTGSALSAAEATRQQALEELENLRQDLEQKETAWKMGLETSGLGTEEAYLRVSLSAEVLRERSEKLIRYRSALEAAREAFREQTALLEGRQQPQVEQLKQKRSDAELHHKTLAGQISVARSRTAQMEQDARDLGKRMESYDLCRRKLDEDQEFSDRLRGVRGVSLRRYVLGVMLTSITAAANQLLKSVHGGRYQLFRTDNTAGRTMKAGLELEVYDAQNNERRSVTTLSGGEKFLVSLSLAIGLSTVVQAQVHGMRLEAMFIDEGFGSLDRESVGDALEVLQGIRRSHGIVGIISHVDQLAETIPTKIMIRKSEKGSSCKICL